MRKHPDTLDIIDAFERHHAALVSNRAKTTEQLRAEQPAFFARIEKLCREAIGHDFRVRLDRKTVQGGTIVACELARIDNNGRTLRAVFAVTLECGAGKLRKTFNVSRLPG
jgi:ribosomal protein S12 methylthiotransferase accessory factor YcaO